MEEIKGVEVIRLLPEDKVLVTFDTNIYDMESVQLAHKYLKEFFGERPILGTYGMNITFIREEEDAEDNFKEHLKTLCKNM